MAEELGGLYVRYHCGGALFSVFVYGVKYALDNDRKRSGCTEPPAGFESEHVGEVIMHRISCRTGVRLELLRMSDFGIKKLQASQVRALS